MVYVVSEKSEGVSWRASYAARLVGRVTKEGPPLPSPLIAGSDHDAL
jgi:hypothetical protein